VLAVLATDIKRLLAYSTASHLGLMVAAFGFQTHYGAEAGTFHLLNHALFKAALFLVAGIVAHAVGTRNLQKLGGLWRALPVTAGIAVVTGLAMAGIPPFNGFYSKELFFEAAYETAAAAGGLAWLYPVGAVVASVFTVVYSFRFIALFFGERPEELDDPHRPPLAMLLPPVVLGVLAAVVSVSPAIAVDSIVQRALEATAVGEPDLHVGIPTSLSPPVLMSAATIALGVGAYAVDERLRLALGRIEMLTQVSRPSWWYQTLISGVETASARLVPAVQNGQLRTYATAGLGTLCGLSLLGYAATAGVPSLDEPTLPLAIGFVLVVAVGAAVAVAIAPSHVAGVLSLSILGFMVAIFFIMASAPDLALTQLVVETLLLVIFLLILEELPAFYSDIDLSVVVRDAGVSLLVGATAFVSVLLTARDPDDPLTETARFYVEQAIPGGGGTNVVNIILVDFRGFDTLGELLVVATAAISVLVLLTMRSRGETR
jgi:multicomponent Na+:H+ antiporter subunit A